MNYTIAFVGNPNVGKSAWINALSGADFKVGNWAGVTLDKKEAFVTWGSDVYHLIDLPGMHGFHQSSDEEGIGVKYLRNTQVDVLVNVVDASNLASNLYLTLALRELQIPTLILFSFIDEVEKQNLHIDTLALSRRLGMDILEVSVLRNKDYARVRKAICQYVSRHVCYEPLVSGEVEKRYVKMFHALQVGLPYESCAYLHRMLCGYIQADPLVLKQLKSRQIDLQKLTKIGLTKYAWLKERYEAIQGLLCYVEGDKEGKYRRTRKIDAVLLHRWLGLPLFFLMFSAMLFMIFQFTTPWNDFISYLMQGVVIHYLHGLLSFLPEIIRKALLDGVMAGVGGVLSFVPLMLCLYFMLAFLEESGYMARISFLMDRMMQCFHLSGKSFVALMLGFGCNVAAIYASKAMENEKQRKLCALLVPFMSCGARLPLYAMFASAFFTHQGGLMIVTLYALGIVMAFVIALLFSKSKIFVSDTMQIASLPVYRMPLFPVLWKKVRKEVKDYIKKAVGVVSFAMLIMWGLAYFPSGDMATSYIAKAAQFVQPIFEPLGFGNRWESVAALPGGIIAKESIVGWYEQILQAPQQTSDESFQQVDLNDVLLHMKQAFHKSFFFFVPMENDVEETLPISSLWTDRYAKLRAFCFMVYVLFSVPCVMTLQAIRHVYGWKLTLFSIFLMLLIPYVSSFVIFQVFSALY